MANLLVHSDWSVSERKRWATVGMRREGSWVVSAPEPSWGAERLLSAATMTPTIAGFDFPIGVPRIWGEKTGESSFPALLSKLSNSDWAEFFEVARVPDQITVRRPFYPYSASKKGMVKKEYWMRAHGVTNAAELLRECEGKTQSRAAASSLFWTIGAQQVGKAALAGWREVVIPCVNGGARIWPFDCDLQPQSAGLTLVETYPAEVYRHVGVRFRADMSKRRQADRTMFAMALKNWAVKRGVSFTKEAHEQVDIGFGDRADGEDRFDSFVGLCAMIEVVDGHLPAGAPESAKVKVWEGWILGQQS